MFRTGISGVLISENGPQFVSETFAILA